MSITGTNTPIRKSVRVRVDNRKPASIPIPSTNPTPSIGTDVNNGRQHPNLMFGSYKGCKRKQKGLQAQSWTRTLCRVLERMSITGTNIPIWHLVQAKVGVLKRTRHLGHGNLIFYPGWPLGQSKLVTTNGLVVPYGSSQLDYPNDTLLVIGYPKCVEVRPLD